MRNWSVKAVAREVLFRRYARRSGQVLCSERPAVEWAHDAWHMHYGIACPGCGACV